MGTPVAAFDLVILMYLHLPEGARRRVLRAATRALAPGATLLVVGHDSTDLIEGLGGAQDPAVLFGPEDIVGDLDGIDIGRAERVRRPVATDDGEVDAIDTIVEQACRPVIRPGRAS